MKKIRIILPVYNEEESILEFYNELKLNLSKIDNYNFDTLFVVDKSTDNTEKIIQEICENNKNVEAILMSSRFGHQECIYAGLEYSKKYDAVIMLDCDFQHPIELIEEMTKKFSSGYDIINSKRSENTQRSFFKRIGTSLFYNLVKKYALPNLEKNSADFRLLSNKIVKIILENFSEKQILIRGIISLIGFNSCTIEYKENPRKHGKTKYSFFNMLKFAINGIISFTSIPLYVIFFTGFVTTLLSIVVLFYFIIYYIFSNNIPEGWTSIATLQLIFGSINLLFLGFVGIYIGKIFDETKSRPKYLIERKISNKDE